MADWAPFAAQLLPTGAALYKHGGYGMAEPSLKKGLVAHSAEGGLSAAMSQLQSTTQVSWHFTNPKEGKLLQHYPVGYACWASGSKTANVDYVACEHEGKAGEPLTENQVDNLVQLIMWLADTFNWPELQRPQTAGDLHAQLYEHKEMTRFGSSATACPSNRIPWAKVMTLLREPAGPGPVLLSDQDRIYACVSAAQFVRLGWNLQDLHPNDKQALKELAERANA